MTNNARILNLTRKFSLKYKQALKAVDNCACAWVEPGVSIRDLTLAESIMRRNEQSRQREPLESAEIPGLIFKPPTSGQMGTREVHELVMRANSFCGLANG